jgi:hypothetical protein
VTAGGFDRRAVGGAGTVAAQKEEVGSPAVGYETGVQLAAISLGLRCLDGTFESIA